MEDPTKHTKLIDIEKVFSSKNPGLKKLIPGFLFRYLKRIIHQEEVNQFINSHSHLYGIDFADAIIKCFKGGFETVGEENIPIEGRFIFAANHPLGGLDGMILTSAVGKHHKNLKFPVNDILMNLTNLKEIFLPINKHGSQGREAARLMEKAYQSDNQILMFPAGLVSRRTHGRIEDLEWKKNFVKKAINHNRDIIPVHISGRNTNFFYNLANWRKRLGVKANIEMLYLVDEVYKQKEKTITITFGKPIRCEQLQADYSIEQWAQKIKEQVYALKK